MKHNFTRPRRTASLPTLSKTPFSTELACVNLLQGCCYSCEHAETLYRASTNYELLLDIARTNALFPRIVQVRLSNFTRAGAVQFATDGLTAATTLGNFAYFGYGLTYGCTLV
jgi:hypothetical protein